LCPNGHSSKGKETCLNLVRCLRDALWAAEIAPVRIVGREGDDLFSKTCES
jgi:hypothetical protein